ncbi:hypothetical protein OHB06_51175 [Streptomyces sp. NBC_01604]|uniref:hypothetical protein n=1 Tax=Streptomyces sp. NBC_01604 TaxID=2975894 RepID=UPI00224F1577|nr:hypothetical protein [Streptomyces sp. NBC_01373]
MTTVKIRQVVERLVTVGQWKPGDPEVLVVLDAGSTAPRATVRPSTAASSSSVTPLPEAPSRP